jgi:hypothetical protein
MSATSCSFASLVRRTATGRERGCAVEHDQAEGAAARRMSAHQALRSAPGGRITQSRPLFPASALARDQRARPVDDGNPSPRLDRRHTRCLMRVVRPLPRAPWISVRRPLGTAIRQRTVQLRDPVGIATAPPTRGGDSSAASC